MRGNVFRIIWIHADLSEHVGSAPTLREAQQAAVDLRPRGAVRAVVKEGRKIVWRVTWM